MTTDETVLTEDPTGADDLQQPPGEITEPRGLNRFARRARNQLHENIVAVLLALLVVTSTALAAGLLYFQYRPDRATDAAATRAATTAASEGAVTVLSYSPDTFDRDVASAKQRLTGAFLAYYSQFTQEIVGPAAKQKGVKTSAVVVRAAVSHIDPDAAAVLVFVDQSTVSADRPEPALSSSSVLVTLTRADNRWLISSFDPI
jgi:Mce-associated membrane protein